MSDKNAPSVMDDWVYAERQLMASFDTELLEKHATVQLARALNTRQLIAVVGSGVSAGYGQPNWRELLRNTAEMVEDNLIALLGDGVTRASPTKDLVKAAEAHAPELASLTETFRKTLSSPETIPADQIPIAFEICENLFAGVCIRERERVGKSISHRRETRDAHRYLRERLKWQLKDNRGRAELLMDKLLRVLPETSTLVTTVTDLKAELSFEGDSGSRDAFAAAFGHLLYSSRAPRSDDPQDEDRIRSAGELLCELHGLNGTLGKRLIAQWLTAEQRSKGPDAHHLIDAGILLLNEAGLERVLTDLRRDAQKLAGGRGGLEEMRASRALMPRHRDPFAVLVDELKIKRILTTNYDGEIDQFLEGLGFSEVAHRPQPVDSRRAPDDVRVPTSRSLLADGGLKRAEILAYEAGAAAFLYDYGADTREHRIQVLHLHGRARSEASWLVLSERDYRARYARDDDPDARADDAMRLVFTANPLLFLGLGMQEPDILRPLRTYSEDVSRLCDRPAIALMPRMADEARRRSSKIESLSRYGVYTLHYGEATFRDGAAKATCDRDFMSKLLAWQKAASGLIVAREAALKPSDDVEANQKIAETLAAAEKTFAGAPTLAHTTVLAVEQDTTAAAAIQQMILQARTLSRELLSGRALAAHELAAFRITCDGFLSVILTTFMTAWLRRMVDKWAYWKEDWSSAPNLREPMGAQVQARYRHREVTRHRNVLRNLDREIAGGDSEANRADAPSTDRFFAGGPSPAFQVLRSALHEQIAPASRGRRIFYLLGGRGAGLGDMFSVMGSPRRFAFLCHWLGLTKAIPAPPKGQNEKQAKDERRKRDETASEHTRNIHRAFLNLGMSHEVISTFDRLNRFLEEFANLAEGKPLETPTPFVADRLGRTEAVMRRLEACGPDLGLFDGGMRRAVVVFSHLNVLFDKSGRAKNAQVGRLFNLITSDLYARAPVDFIFMMSEEHLPATTRGAFRLKRKSPVKLIWAKGAGALAENQLLERLRATFGQTDLTLPTAKDGAKARTYVYFLQSVRPVAFATRFFPRAASAVAHLSQLDDQADRVVRLLPVPGPADAPSPGAAVLGFENETAIRTFQVEMRDAFEDSLRSSFSNLSRSEVTRKIQRLGQCFASDEIDDILLEVLLESDALQAGGEMIDQAHKAIAARMGKLDSTPFDASPRPPRTLKPYFKQLLSAAGYSRYALTLIFAAIDDMIARRIATKPLNQVNLAAIERFIKQLRLATAGKSATIREDIVISHVLQLYQTDTLSALGQPLPAWPFATGRFDEAPQHLLFELQEKILVALAIIGQPVEASVLTGIHPVAAALEDLLKATPAGADEGRDCLLQVLDLMVSRCLLFRIAPKGDEHDGATDPAGHRFATHKSLRRHLYRQFNAPLIDYSDVDQLTVSLYATQPSDLPRPTAEGHRRVRQLIEQLSRFERSERQPSHLARDPFLDEVEAALKTDPDKAKAKRKDLERARLRAAYGALRSIYSVGVVSRFSAYEDEGIETPDNGYFENHRLRVRWMLRMANHLDGVNEAVEDDAEGDPAIPLAHETPEPSRTFHAEEVVWLFNECGVLSLAQGRISDAVTLLSQAQKFARRFIEAREWGPLHARIGLNKAVADIERGRLRDAKAVLERIVAEGEREHEALVLIAKGYLALIQDLMGDATSAAAEYEQVVPALARMGRLRSAAIFSVQHSDCLRGRGAAFLDEAARLSDQACAYATEGGHEDIRQIGQLSKAWIEIARFGGAMDVTRRRKLDATLDEVSSYAKLMGMPRLMSRTALARGSFHLAHGDFRAAASYAQAALRTATRYDIELRKISAMRLLGAALLRLHVPEARGLLVRARELAYHIDFNAEIGRIEEALVQAAAP